MKKGVGLLLLAALLICLFTGCIASKTQSSSIDIDLTKMSSTMVYAEVFNMMWNGDKYVGKTVKVQGQYVAYYDEEADEYYHAVIITDALACCEQGLEFELSGDYQYPDDYPEENAAIEIVGVIDIGYYGEYPFIYIRTDEIILLD